MVLKASKFKVNDEKARLFTLKRAIQQAQAEAKKTIKDKVNLIDQLLAMRRKEAENN